MKIEKPNFTQIPNVLIDEALKNMGNAEVKVVMAIARKTFGWQKTADKISLSQIQTMTGLSRQGVINGIEDGIKHGIIDREPSGKCFYYSILVNEVDQLEDQGSQRSRLALVNVVDQLDHKLVNVVDSQKKVNLNKIKESEKIPETLNQEPFLSTWNNWLSYRKEIKHTLSNTTARSQLTKLSKYTPEIATAMLNQSIENGWQGIFPLKEEKKALPQKRPIQYDPIPR